MTFKKRRIVLYQQLQGAGFYDALAAFEFASRLHTGTRKDLITPEFQHQLEIGLFAMLLPDLMHREDVLCTIALHDTREDFDVSDGEIRDIFTNEDRQSRVGNAVYAMTKKFRGSVRNAEELFDEMSRDACASIAKGCDRQHNLLSMVGVFTPEKQKAYCQEGEDLFLPMLKKAKRNFPHQVRAYELLKFNLTSQIELIRAGLA